MPLWDSVHRGLEKASHEAARLARVQRLRSSSETLVRQVQALNETMLHKTMELFVAGQLAQPELALLCQELIHLQQQLNQAQTELKQLQTNAPQPSATPEGNFASLPPGSTEGASYPQANQESMATMLAPPPPEYQSYLESTEAVDVPPPPPIIAAGEANIIQARGENAPSSIPRCPVCHSEIEPQHAFCQQCGSPIQNNYPVQQATVRASRIDSAGTETGDQETVRAQEPSFEIAQLPALPAEKQENSDNS
jgi:hypothetical protein